jgi:hypothetical protein
MVDLRLIDIKKAKEVLAMPKIRPRTVAMKKKLIRQKEARRTKKFGVIGNMIRGKR